MLFSLTRINENSVSQDVINSINNRLVRAKSCMAGVKVPDYKDKSFLGVFPPRAGQSSVIALSFPV